MRLDRFEPEMRLETEYRDETFEGGSSASTRELIFRENIEFDFDGSVYHPKLMTFGGVLDLGLEQREVHQRGAATVRSNDDNNHYDLRSTLLKDHPYSARLFAQRTQVRIRQSFFPTNDAVVTRNGAVLMAKEWVVPSQLEYADYHFVGETGDLRTEDRESLNLMGSRNTETVNVHYTVFYQEVDSDLAGGRYDDFQALGGGTLRFGHDLTNSFTIDGQRRRQTGDIENENTNVSARSLFTFSDTLENRSGVSFGSSDFGGPGADSTDRADVYTELEHQLYDSLTTTVRGDYMDQTIGVGGIERLGGIGRLAYRKKVPFGDLHLDYRFAYSRQDESGRLGANITVPNEPHVVAPGTPVFLNNPNVDPNNILVTDLTGAIVYSTPTDYIIEQVGAFTRLVFPVGSAIVPGQTILVTYSFASTFDRVFDTTSNFAGIQLIFGEPLSVNAHWSELDQDLVSGTVGSTLDQSTEIGAGVRAKLGSHNFELDYLDRDSLLTPFSRLRFSWNAWTQLSERFSLTASASAYETRFKDQNDRERNASGVVSVTWQPEDNLSVEARTELRRNELRTENGWGTFFQALVRYRFRKTSVELFLLSSKEEWDISSDRDVLRALLTVSRRF